MIKICSASCEAKGRLGKVEYNQERGLFLFGAHISPLRSASSHVDCDPIRTRKLLLNRLEINRLREKITQKGATVVPLKLYWARGHVKLEIGVAKGKKAHDKRQDIKDRDWKLDKARALKESNQ